MKKLLLILVLTTIATTINAMDNNNKRCYKLQCDAVAKRKEAEAAAALLKKTFFTAVEDGNLETVEQLLEQNPFFLNLQARQMKTPLILAAHSNKPAIITLLLNAGANIETRGYRGRTALIVAADKGHLNIVNLLLEGGAYSKAQNEQGQTASMVAAEKRHYAIVTRLNLAEATATNVQSSKSTPSLKRVRSEENVTSDTPAKKQVTASASINTNDDNTCLDFFCDFLSSDIDQYPDEPVNESQKNTSPNSEARIEKIVAVDDVDNVNDDWMTDVLKINMDTLY